MIKRLILFLNRKGHKYIRREAPSAPPLGELLSEREAEGVRLDEWKLISTDDTLSVSPFGLPALPEGEPRALRAATYYIHCHSTHHTVPKTTGGVCKAVSERYVTGRVREPTYPYYPRSVTVRPHCGQSSANRVCLQYCTMEERLTMPIKASLSSTTGTKFWVEARSISSCMEVVTRTGTLSLRR